jgi:hypothetical protein
MLVPMTELRFLCRTENKSDSRTRAALRLPRDIKAQALRSFVSQGQKSVRNRGSCNTTTDSCSTKQVDRLSIVRNHELRRDHGRVRGGGEGHGGGGAGAGAGAGRAIAARVAKGEDRCEPRRLGGEPGDPLLPAGGPRTGPDFLVRRRD